MHSDLRAQLAVQGLEALSTPSEIVARLVELTLSDSSTLKEVIELVRSDPGLAVEVLRRQSPQVLKRRNALHIPNAVHALGMEGMRELALRNEALGSSPPPGAASEPSATSATRAHAVASAAAAYELCAALGEEEPEVAYAAGLLSCIGVLALRDLFEAHLPELDSRTAGQDLERALELERQALGIDHESLAVVIAESWSLPSELQDVLIAAYRSSEQLERLRASGSNVRLATLARSAAYAAEAAGFPRLGAAPLPAPPEDVVDTLAAVDVDRLFASARSAVRSATELWRPLADTQLDAWARLQRIGSELRRRLLRAERRLRAEEAVNHVLHYGLKRLGDNDPLPGVMFLAMESMGFQRISCLEIDARAGRLEVLSSAAASGHSKVDAGRWIPFPEEPGHLAAPAIVTGESKERSHQLVLELIGAGAAVTASLRESKAGTRRILVADRGRAGRAPTPGEERCLGIIAEQASLLLQFEELSKERERMATQDPLTGAATRRRLMDRLDVLMNQSSRTRLPLSLLLLDLDHFKRFNDTMGHQVGDRLLQDLVAVLSAKVRKGDLIARYGGEEFVVLLPNCALENALAVAESLRGAVYEYGIAQRETYQDLPVSISIGAAQWCAAESAAALIARADAALYASKHAGRNRVSAAAA